MKCKNAMHICNFKNMEICTELERHGFFAYIIPGYIGGDVEHRRDGRCYVKNFGNDDFIKVRIGNDGYTVELLLDFDKPYYKFIWSDIKDILLNAISVESIINGLNKLEITKMLNKL